LDEAADAKLRQTLRRPPFTLRALLGLTVIVALALCCVILTRQLRETEAVLARNAWAADSGAIPPGKFRLLINRVVDAEDVQVVVMRFEANEEHFVTADGQGSTTTPNEDGELHWCEIRIVTCYDSTSNRLIALTQVRSASGSAGGSSNYPLKPGHSGEGFTLFDVKPGLYDLNQTIDLYERPDGKGTLSVR
jgi:hypothetical protein